LIIGAISSVATAVLYLFVPFGSIISAVLITPAFSLSLIRVYLSVTADKKPEVSDAFSGYDDFWSAFKVTFFVGLFTFLWSLLFVIPGIVKSYAYSMSMYILAENKGMGAFEAINRSKEMTNGHKMDLFVLTLSFIGWALLCSITCGIAYIYVGPYMNTTFANYYLALKGAAATAKAEPSSEIEAQANEPVSE